MHLLPFGRGCKLLLSRVYNALVRGASECASISISPSISTPKNTTYISSHRNRKLRSNSLQPSQACYASVKFCFYSIMLHTGRRRTKLNRAYNGPARQGPVRHISPSSLSLQRVHEQNRVNMQKKDPAKAPEPAPGVAAKGKPRLLLMGQRRSVMIAADVDKSTNILLRSGKSSISSVVFHKMPPQETLFLESTARIQKDSMQ